MIATRTGLLIGLLSAGCADAAVDTPGRGHGRDRVEPPTTGEIGGAGMGGDAEAAGDGQMDGVDPAGSGGTGEDGSADGEGADTGMDAMMSPNSGPCGGADIVCDDFEADSLDPGWSFTGAIDKEPSVDTSKAFSGTRSITFASADTQGAFIYPDSGLPTADNRFYMRAMVSFARPMRDMNGHVAFLVAADAPENGAELRLGASRNFASQQVMLDLNLLGVGNELTQFSNGDVTGGQGTTTPGTTLEANVWYCIEAHFNGADHAFQVWVDGQEITELHVTDWKGQRSEPWSPGYVAAKLGVQNYSGDIGQVWYDDVAVSTGPIGCP